jgi:hypothetical protein
MKILDVKDGKMLAGSLNYGNNNIDDGIYIEVNEKDLSKNVVNALSKLGGCGVRYREYYRSNTNGKAHGKYFKKVYDRIKFRLKRIHKIEKLNNSKKYFVFGNELIEKCLNRDIEWKFNCLSNDKYLECNFIAILTNDDYTSLNHELEKDKKFSEYKNFFIGKDKCKIIFKCNIDKNIQIPKNGSNLKPDSVIDILNISNESSYNWTIIQDTETCFYGNGDDKITA